ncbi:M10 family metallopeptidase C-terminal domain-containing protein [Novosphingobium cyanobacteriorum]|uniref:M10 family metallopeptidase C-terminal domain-containing protein n=1 Tax=Novosphingobium cyanobacteriorum TaxID=3024215 RepID=A0ABT6CQI6_9SPHN|nr:cadherin domain-containing protein [Novosphingobium cyanobacteriorum]MDF8335538.1 M10 family metallopeptidase C-terminal domain-containing protein [Novosphingobium cyanobacteriorum]
MIVDGSLSDWTSADRIDSGLPSGYAIFAKSDGDGFVFAMQSPTAIGEGTTAWLNTDRNSTTGFQIFGFAGGAEFNVNVGADGQVSLYSGDAGQTLVKSGLEAAWSADRTVVEFKVAKADIGTPSAIDTLYDINNNVFLPGNFSSKPFTVYNETDIVPAADQRIAIVYSETTAKNYFGDMAYSQLFMAAQSQATQAGIPFDILQESDLTSLATLAKYDTLVFPSFRNVEVSQVDQIANTLEQATRQFGIGLVAAGEFMTNDQNNNALAGDSYARMKSLFDATRVDGGTGDVTLTATDASGKILDGYGNGELIRQYTNVGWNAFASVSGTGSTIATETIAGQSYSAALATQTGGRNVLFSSAAVMADNNLLQKAIDYSVNGTETLSLALRMTRQSGITATRVDMDQSQEQFEVKPDDGSPGVYDKLIPIVSDWKAKYGFVGSYYLNVGNDPANGATTDWAVSLPYYKALIERGNELGSHSYTHPENTNLLTDQQLQFEFADSKSVLQQQLSAYLGSTYNITGAAIPGNPESLATAQKILQYYNYITGGYSGVGAGYPNAFGYLNPTQANSGSYYFAPNIMSDFTLIEFQKKTIAQASAEWAKQFSEVTSHGAAPIVLWTWHDYGAAAWNSDGPSPYSTQMFTDFIAMASNADMEFVTLGDLAQRMNAFQSTTVTTSVTGNVITANVAASKSVGTFALELGNTSAGQVIQKVSGWYAYDSDSVFLPASGGSFAVTVGAAPDDVTHVTALPSRAVLESISGDGRNLTFSLSGEGKVVVDVQAPGNDWVSVTGGTVVSAAGEIYTIDIGAPGPHTISVGYVANLAPVIASNGAGATATISLAENLSAVTTVLATDANKLQGDIVAYSIQAGGDGALFAINSATGALTFRTAPDFEAPADLNRDNVYNVTIVATDARGLADTQALEISVTNKTGINRTGSLFNDTMNGTGEEDSLNGSWGNDTINGLGGNDKLYGDVGNDRLNGGDGTDQLYGQSGDDTLDAGSGNDLVVGGTGRDTLIGGGGLDTFLFQSTNDSATSTSGRDIIRDFELGIDKIDISQIDASVFQGGDQAFSFLATPTTKFTASSQVHYFYQFVNGVEYTVVEGRTSGTGAAFSIGLLGHLTLSASDFVL